MPKPVCGCAVTNITIQRLPRLSDIWDASAAPQCGLCVIESCSMASTSHSSEALDRGGVEPDPKARPYRKTDRTVFLRLDWLLQEFLARGLPRKMRSGVKGATRILFPVAAKIAFATAATTGIDAVSPAPEGSRSGLCKSLTSISGTSLKLETGFSFQSRLVTRVFV